jgi:multidrug efflux pump subunit AcrB
VTNGVARTDTVSEVKDDGRNAIVTGLDPTAVVIANVAQANVGNGDRVTTSTSPGPASPMLIALTTLAAIMALRSLVVQQTPNSGLPNISVSVGYSGASTTELVTEVAQPIEDQLAGTPFLDHIDTTIQTGQVNISASFSTQSTDTENIANVEKAIQAAARSLPSTITAPTIRVADPSEPTVIALALVSSKYPEAVLASIANNSIVPAIEQLPGISNVNVTGTTQPAFVVTVDPNMLAFNARFDALRARYAQRWLPAAMRTPWPIVTVAAVSCVVAFFLVPGLVGEEFIPPQNQGIITVQVTYPAGYPVAQTNAAMSRLEAIVKQAIPEKALQYETTVAGAYSAAFGGFVQEGNVGQITVYLNKPQQTTQYTNVLQQKLPGAASGALVAVTASTGLGGGAQQPIDELVSTSDGSDPTASAQKVFRALSATPGATGAQDSATNAAPQMEVEFDRPRLQALDVSDGTAAAAVEAAFGGDVASQIETPDRGLTDIEVIYPRSAQTSLDDVLAIPIRAQSGGIVRLGDVAHLKYVPAPLGLEPGGAQRASLAIVVIGGLLSSLVLTLFIVPIMYAWIAPKELRRGVVFADERKKERPDEPPQRGGPEPQPA